MNDLINSHEFINLGINYCYGVERNTLLHAAYRWNKPKMVEFLIKNGADERIPDDRGLVPMEVAKDSYSDSLPRVVNEVVQRYFKCLPATSPNDPDVLFDVIQDKNWKYLDTEGSYKRIPFRDGRLISQLGLPDLTYHINCFDLSNLFIKAAHKIGMKAEEVIYYQYSSIDNHEIEKKGIFGKLVMFDNSKHPKKGLGFIFDQHCVAYSSGWHYDVTLMCKYQDKNAVLRRS